MTYVIPIFLYADSISPLNVRVLDYVVRHPRCRRNDVAAGLGVLPNHVSSTLAKLAGQGKLRRVRDASQAGKWVWEPGEDPVIRKKEPVDRNAPSQKTVTEWKPERRRDELTAALFGMSNVDRRQD